MAICRSPKLITPFVVTRLHCLPRLTNGGHDGRNYSYDENMHIFLATGLGFYDVAFWQPNPTSSYGEFITARQNID